MGKREKKERKKSNGFIRFIKIIIILALIALGVFFGALSKEQRDKILGKLDKAKVDFKEISAPKLKIIDEESKERPIAVVYDNNVDAWSHSGLSNAYAIYEFPVEGGESRVLGFYKNKKDLVVGPIRSARHYFLDYILEHDAIFAHIGQSPKARADIQTLDISDINGQAYDSGSVRNKKSTKEYWRESSKYSPHNSYSDLTNLKDISEKQGFKKETNQKVPFKYSAINVDLPEDKSKKIKSLTGAYHEGNATEFIYSEKTKMYQKKSKGVLQLDEKTGKPLELKNIVILKTSVTVLPDGDLKDRKNVKTTGVLEGIYSTNGRVMKIKAKKDSRAAKTKYLDEEGNEIIFNDGITFVMIVPDKKPGYYDYNEVNDKN